MPVDIHLFNARLRGAIIALIVVAALYLGKAIFIPIALAVLLSFVLAPLVELVERLRGGRIASVIVVQVFCTVLLGLMITVLGTQLLELSSKLPEYKRNLVQRVEDFRAMVPSGLTRAQSALEEIEEEVLGDEEQAASPKETDAVVAKVPADKASRDKPKGKLAGFFGQVFPSLRADPEKANDPVPVEVVSSRQDTISRLFGFVNPVLGPIGTFGIVIVLTIFILLDREDFRNRIVQLFGSSNLAVATRAISDATDRSMTWLRTMVLINLMYGAAVATGLAIFGLPNALLWGGLAFFCRFLPYVGPWIGASIPVVLSLGVFEGWTLPLGIVVLYIVLELIVNMILEPWLYGRSLGLTSIGIILAAIFWTWLWGPVGLLVAVPVTMWLVVLGHHIPQMSYFTLLFGDMSEMPSYHSLYQRLLAFDEPEAIAIMERHFEQEGPSAVFDRVLAPLFLRLSLDRQSGFVDERQTEFVFSTIHERIEEFADEAKTSETTSELKSGTEAELELNSAPRQLKILVVPTGDEPEEIMADVLRLMSLRQSGRDVELTGSSLLTNEILERIGFDQPDAVVFCCSTVGSQTKVRAVCKRLPRDQRGFPVYVWQAHDSETAVDRPNRHMLDIDGAFSSVGEVVAQLSRVNHRVNKAPTPKGLLKTTTDQRASAALDA